MAALKKRVTITMDVDDHGAETGRQLDDIELRQWAMNLVEGDVGGFHGLDDVSPRAGKVSALLIEDISYVPSKEIGDFVSSISHLWEGEALDGDQTKRIADAVLAELDYQNGNL